MAGRTGRGTASPGSPSPLSSWKGHSSCWRTQQASWRAGTLLPGSGVTVGGAGALPSRLLGRLRHPSEAREVGPTQVLEGAWREPSPSSGQEAVSFCLGLPVTQAPEGPAAHLPQRPDRLSSPSTHNPSCGHRECGLAPRAPVSLLHLEPREGLQPSRPRSLYEASKNRAWPAAWEGPRLCPAEA